VLKTRRLFFSPTPPPPHPGAFLASIFFSNLRFWKFGDFFFKILAILVEFTFFKKSFLNLSNFSAKARNPHPPTKKKKKKIFFFFFLFFFFYFFFFFFFIFFFFYYIFIIKYLYIKKKKKNIILILKYNKKKRNNI